MPSIVDLHRPTLLLLLPVLLIGCGDEFSASGADADADSGAPVDAAAGPDAASGSDAAGDGAVGDGGADAAVAPAVSAVGLAVLHRDKNTSSLSLLSPTGAVAKDDCLHSGSTSPVLSQAFSSDVALPSQIQPNNAVVVIDRKTAVLTYIDGATCTVQRQINVGTSFEANPHDVVGLSPTKAYVARYAQNLAATPAPADFDEGNDILVFDPSTGALIKRIDLLPFAVPSATNEPTLPRADRMVRVGDRVYVSLNNLSDDYKAAGHGRIVIIDTNTDAAVGQVDLPAHKNCGALTHFGNELFVACGGVFADGDMQAARAGIVRISLPSNQMLTLGASAFSNGVVSLFTVAAMDATRVAAVTLGEFGKTPDVLWGANFASTSAASGFTGSKAYTLWSVVADSARNVVWVTDSGMQPALRSFTMGPTGALTPGPVVQTSSTRKLPPREIAWF